MIGSKEQQVLLKHISALTHQASSIRALYEPLLKPLHDLLAVDYVSLALLNGNNVEILISWADGKNYSTSSHELPLESIGSLAWVQEHRRALLRPDISLDQRFPEDGQLVEAGVRSLLNLPLMAGEDLLGTLNLGYNQANAQSTADIELLEPVCAHLALAIENIWLRTKLAEAFTSYSQLQQRLAEVEEWGQGLEQLLNAVTALQRIASTIASHDTLEQVLQRILETITNFMQIEHHVSALLLVAEGQSRMILRVIRPSSPEFSGSYDRAALSLSLRLNRNS